MADTPRYEDTAEIDEFPSFEQTIPLEESPEFAKSIKDVEAGILKGSLLSKISPALGAIPRAMVSGESIPEAYRSLAAPLEQDIQTAEERSPVLSTIGEIGGGLLPATPVSAASKALTAGRELGTLGKMALSAGEGGAIGLESAIAGDRPIGQEIETGAILGAAMPGVALGIGKTAVKLKDIAKESSIGKAFQLGREGLDLGNITDVAKRAENKVKEIYQPLKDVMKQIYDMRQGALNKATEAGERISVAGSLPYSLDEITTALKNSPAGLLPERSKVLEAVKFFTKEGKDLTPIEASELNSTINELSPKLYNTNIYPIIKELQTNLRSQFDKIPGLERSNKLYNEFLNSTVDEVLSKGMSDISKTSYGSLSKPDATLYKKIEDLVKGVGEKELQAVGTKEKIGKKLTEFAEKEPELLEKAKFPKPEEFTKRIEQAGAEREVYKAAQRKPEIELTKPVKSIAGFIKPEVVASKAGKMYQDLSKSLYDATPDALKDVSNKLSQNEATRNVAESLLNAIDGNDSIKKNAAIFTILQSPSARKLLGMEESVK
jgi:hypothetical protein